MEYKDAWDAAERDALAKDGWRLHMAAPAFSRLIYVMQRALPPQPSYPIYMTSEGPLTLNTPEAWKRYYEEING